MTSTPARPSRVAFALAIVSFAFAFSLLFVGALRGQPDPGSGAPPPRETPDASIAALPEGVRAVWDPTTAHRETTPTRERICVNGLWRWRPADLDDPDASISVDIDVPGDSWGHFKVPGCWPGITDYLQKDFQVVHAHAAWKSVDLRRLRAAWYQREITIPASWSGRRIVLEISYLNSFASVRLDGKRLGDLRFPAGEVDLTAAARPGETQVLSLLVVAMPLEAVRLAFTDSASARAVKGTVARRGLCGDVFLTSTPAGARIRALRIDTSVRRSRCSFDVALEALPSDPDRVYRLRAEISDRGRVDRVVESRRFRADELESGRFRFDTAWKPERLWDLSTPGQTFELVLSLLGGTTDRDDEARLDTLLDATPPERFGFRELWIEGRDLILNGTRVFLTAVPLDNAQIGAALASYDGARESLERLKAVGINLVYTHNYGCEPGAHLSFAEILRAADDVGMLVSLSQPHFSAYRWETDGDDARNGYAEHAGFYTRVAGNHPSVALYGMSHNATGYDEDMSPDGVVGLEGGAARDGWASRNARRALRAEAIVQRLDSGRIVYHHAGGDLGAMYTSNFYPNFVPPQELADWFEGWSTRGRKPLFLCEFGAPLSWDWTMYRGWYRGEREFGSARVPWELCVAEWNAQFLGDRAYEISERERRNLRWEASQFRADRVWHRWDYPTPVGSSALDERSEIFAAYFTDVWRALRTRGVSAVCPWDLGHHWKLRDGVKRERREIEVDWDSLQRPGFSPDFIDERYERFDLAFERDDWLPTAAGEAFLRNNQPLLAYIGGKPADVTSRDHLFLAGEIVEKQLVVINNSRRSVSARCAWSLALPAAIRGEKTIELETGRQAYVPLRLELPAALAPGAYRLEATFTFDDGSSQWDTFSIDVLAPAPEPPRVPGTLALFDPRGETSGWLRRLGVPVRAIDASADLADERVLIIGKGALTVDGPAPDLRHVRDGLRVIVFEQTAAVLERRLGFRVVEYGLRQAFARVPEHPLLAGLGAAQLRDWRGESTLTPRRLAYTLRPQHGPTVSWCDLPIAQAWRAGNQGNVASVLIEKPARGDFLPLIDGGFSLQYSPLLEFREGRGVVVFCQMDLTGRTESDPAAERLARNLLEHVGAWKATPERRAVYVGEAAGRRHLEASGLALETFDPKALPADHVLVAGPASGDALREHRAAIAGWLDAGGRVLAIGLPGEEASAFLPVEVRTRAAEHIASDFEAEGSASVLVGVSPADIHNRDPRELPLITGGVERCGNGVLARSADDRVAFLQLVPWQFDVERQGTRRVFRRASFALSRLLGNLGVRGATPLLRRFREPVAPDAGEKRWLEGLYLDAPREWDHPYRFFRW